ncbi:unannotated protein [freshwater metagenome]|jgi:hypothetical protein|uniref:Unannotated protein n=1 Tax=freshwater metagenome TaxID=449393 RepID=A0A6J6IVF8_9ZZZZ|nr:hypothetical protein [Actinomycetota bacterium]
MNGLDSPLSGSVKSRFGGTGKYRNKVVLGTAVVAFVPFLLSTFAASVTVGTGALEFGQGSQQAIACDDTVYVALGEEWFASPVPEDSSAGYFRLRTATISNLNLTTCAGKKLRLRLIDGSSAEIVLGSLPDAKVLEVTIPREVPVSNLSDPTELRLTYLTGQGQPIAGAMAANVGMNVSGTSVYDGSSLTNISADVMFYLDPTATLVNINGQQVRRATVETVANPGG